MSLYADVFFPWLIERLEGPEVYTLRQRCVSPAKGKVLEIGFGTGKTLPYYSDQVTELIAIEPSAGMHRRSAALLSSVPFPVHIKSARGEALPFKDKSFDTAVCTMTLCSVDSPSAVLEEIQRVLKPGGEYLFLEHVCSDIPRIACRQHLLNPIQRVIGCGCHLTRDSEFTIRNAGFTIKSIARLISQDMPGFDARLYPLILGRAVKSEASR